MKTVFRIVVALPAVLFVVMGLRWLVEPAGMAAQLGFALADGVGRSSQIGDFAAFFLTVGLCALLGVVTARRLWFYPASMLLLLAAMGRVLSWAVHDAAFAGSMIGFEIVVAGIFLAGASWLPERV